ncbi:protein white-like [Dreissena polymorpha]|uniref:protein white-like n=1 Tax=Dreissena polymorpha TaxID=45954 RepID=UPI00226564A1|nr:protein white-like [Dreissena polymorpha]
MAVRPGKETECKAQIEQICDKFDESQICKEILQSIKSLAENPKEEGIIIEEAISGTSRYEASFFQQFRAVFARSWKTTYRDPNILRVNVLQTIILGLVLGLIYLQLDIDQQGVMNANGVMFLVLINLTFTNAIGVLNSFPLETPIFMREYGIGLYGSFEAFCVFTGVLLLVANISVSFGYVVSSAVSSVDIALAISPPMVIPLLMFGGFFLNAE